MTYPEFLEALRNTPRDWCLIQERYIRREVSLDDYQCPLTSLVPHYEPFKFMYAGMELGLSPGMSRRIAAAADGNMRTRNSKMRRDLLEACGLEEAVRG
jgi:hypothetical protein